MNAIQKLRKNIGVIITIFGFMLLCIITFGDLGELITKEYWANVYKNLTAITFVSIGLTFIQVSIKQGLAEQALQRGLNTENTTKKYQEHKGMITSCMDKFMYLPYFLRFYNRRDTALRKRDFIVNNNFTSEKNLLASGRKSLIRQYKKIKTDISASSIQWSSVQVVRDKNGRIATLEEYRRKRLLKAIAWGAWGMIGTALLATGLFFESSGKPVWQKFVTLLTYVVTIAITSIYPIVQNYEKGAFGVPNELDEINRIWAEFKAWEIPQEIIDEMESMKTEGLEVEGNEKEARTDKRNAVQKEQETVSAVQDADTNLLVQPVAGDGCVSDNCAS